MRHLRLPMVLAALLLGTSVAQAQPPVQPGGPPPSTPSIDALPGALLVLSANAFERQTIYSSVSGHYFSEQRFDGLNQVSYGAGTIAAGYTITEQLAVAAWFSGYRLTAPAVLGEAIQSGNQGLQVVYLPYINQGRGAVRGAGVRAGVRVQSGAQIYDGWGPTASPFFDALVSAEAGPVFIDANVGFLFDRSNGLTKNGLVPNLVPQDGVLDPARRYAYNISEANQVRWGAAARIPLLDGRVRPFVEYHGTLYFGEADHPQTLTLGAQGALPLRSRVLAITAGGDFAFAGTSPQHARPRAPAIRGWVLFSFSSPVGNPRRPVRRPIRPIGPPNNPPPVITTGNLQGRVTDSSSGRPLSNVLVEFNGIDRSPVRTSTAGTFRLDRVSPGTVTVRVTAPNYSALVRSVRIEPGIDKQVVFPLQSTEPAGGRVEGKITSKRNEPLAARVIVRRGTATLKKTTTGLDGTFMLELPPGRYTISFEADGYLTKEQPIEVLAGSKQKFVKSLRDDP